MAFFSTFSEKRSMFKPDWHLPHSFSALILEMRFFLKYHRLVNSPLTLPLGEPVESKTGKEMSPYA